MTETTQSNKDIEALYEAARLLPESPARSLMLDAVERVAKSHERRKRILTLIQDALGQLRLDMKYMIFDLAATRRERDEALGK